MFGTYYTPSVHPRPYSRPIYTIYRLPKDDYNRLRLHVFGGEIERGSYGGSVGRFRMMVDRRLEIEHTLIDGSLVRLNLGSSVHFDLAVGADLACWVSLENRASVASIASGHWWHASGIDGPRRIIWHVLCGWFWFPMPGSSSERWDL